MRFYPVRCYLVALVLITPILGCGGGGGSSDSSSDGSLVINAPGGGNNEIDDALEQLDADDAAANSDNDNRAEADDNDVELAFNISSAVTLLTYSEVLEEIDELDSTTTDQLIDIVGHTNLFGLRDNGSLEFAINTEYDLNVLYTVLSPDQQHLYVALDNGWGWWGSTTAGCAGCDYLDFIIEQNCALLVVNMSDNSHTCAAEGLFLQGIDSQYNKTMGSTKPIQFDAEGDLYFLATPFTITTDTFCDTSGGFDENSSDDTLTPGQENGDDSENINDQCQDVDILEEIEWRPQVYQLTPGSDGSGTAVALTSAEDNIRYMRVNAAGDIALQASTDAGNQLSLRRGSTINSLTTAGNWEADFFTFDTGNSILFGEATAAEGVTNGLRFARPNDTALSFATFGLSSLNEGESAKPRHIVLGDDGRVYAFVETTSSSTQVLTLHQLLPYNSSPLKELIINSSNDWLQTLNTMQPIATNGYLFYSRSQSVAGNTIDSLHAINLTTLVVTNLPLTEGVLYDLYTWQLDGDTIHFTGLDQTNQMIISGEVDTTAIAQAAVSDDFSSVMTTTTVAPILASDATIVNSTRLDVTESGNSTVSTPAVNTIHAVSNNPYSLSIEFNTLVDQTTSETGINLFDSDDNAIATLRIWNKNMLHLLPDLDVNTSGDALSDSTGTTPLTSGQSYRLTITSEVQDQQGAALTPVADTLLTID